MAAYDDKEIYVIRRDLSSGQNNRVHGTKIADSQATVLTNVDLGTPSQRSKRPGLSLLEDLSGSAGVGLFGFEPDTGSNILVAMEGTKLWTWPESGSFTLRKSNYTSGYITGILKVGESGIGDVFVTGNGVDNWFRYDPSDLSNPQDLGDTNTSPPLSSVGVYFRNRLFILKQNNLYWADAFPVDYSLTFDRTTNYYRIPVGKEQALIALRDEGIIVFGRDQIWAINPSSTPAATDLPVKIIEYGCRSGKTVCQVGDDIFYLSNDGVRGVFRSQQDKLQSGASYPISYVLKEEVESLNWAYIEKSCAVYFDNKYFISVPVDGSTTNNEVWVYYPASAGWMVISGWNISAWSKMKVSGEERLYAIDQNGKVYRAWSGYSDNGTAINFVEESRKEDFNQPLVKKVGGVLKVRALSSGDYDISVYVSVDDQEYTLLGTMNLAGNAPTLPVSLPFSLADSNIIEESFHLDSLGEWYQIRVKIVHNALNGSDAITIYETSITTYATEYQSE